MPIEFKELLPDEFKLVRTKDSQGFGYYTEYARIKLGVPGTVFELDDGLPALLMKGGELQKKAAAFEDYFAKACEPCYQYGYTTQLYHGLNACFDSYDGTNIDAVLKVLQDSKFGRSKLQSKVQEDLIAKRRELSDLILAESKLCSRFGENVFKLHNRYKHEDTRKTDYVF